ncbi:hypothetical protein GCM10020218_063010 [Dactylosporangium vinaceum]
MRSSIIEGRRPRESPGKVRCFGVPGSGPICRGHIVIGFESMGDAARRGSCGRYPGATAEVELSNTPRAERYSRRVPERETLVREVVLGRRPTSVQDRHVRRRCDTRGEAWGRGREWNKLVLALKKKKKALCADMAIGRRRIVS